jgi:hypothetical protein
VNVPRVLGYFCERGVEYNLMARHIRCRHALSRPTSGSLDRNFAIVA